MSNVADPIGQQVQKLLDLGERARKIWAQMEIPVTRSESSCFLWTLIFKTIPLVFFMWIGLSFLLAERN